MPSSRKEHLVNTALELFYKEGFHATGIDKILRESGVAKMTMYKYFRSKDELVLAVLEEREQRFRDWFFEKVDSMAETPKDKMLAVFDVLTLWFESDFRGCLFINAAAEFSAKNPDIHQFTGEHKRLMGQYLQELAQEADLPNPETLAFQLSLLVEGAIVLAHLQEDKEAAKKAKLAARTLINTSIES